jgi:hypothetical protein
MKSSYAELVGEADNAGVFAVAFLGAVLLYHFVEEPARI